eukprot:3447197-Rhodomonas_salina.1
MCGAATASAARRCAVLTARMLLCHVRYWHSLCCYAHVARCVVLGYCMLVHKATSLAVLAWCMLLRTCYAMDVRAVLSSTSRLVLPGAAGVIADRHRCYLSLPPSLPLFVPPSLSLSLCPPHILP